MTNKAIALIILLLVALIAFPATTYSQQVAALPMEATQYSLRRLAPGVTSETAVFPLDSSNRVRVEILASVGGLTTSIVTPSAQTIDANNVASLGGSFNIFEGDPDNEGLVVMPTLTPGFHYIYEFPSQGAGNYTVQVQSPSNPTDEIGIMIEVKTDSAIRTTLFATDTTVTLGRPVVFSAAVFNGPTALAGATVAMEARRISETPVTPANFTLLDNGEVSDDTAGDGLYSGDFTPDAVGDYAVLAVITGTTPGGASYTRHSLTRIKVVPATSQFTGTVGDEGIDDNSDGFFDRIRLNIQANTTVAGSYSVIAHLKTASGKTVIRGTRIDLATGMSFIPIDFEAEAFVELGENGPYQIAVIEMFHVGEEEVTPADRLEDVGQTAAYNLLQLQRPPLVITGNHSVTGIDTNENGKYETLRVRSEVLAQVAGFYEWSGSLVDASGHEITFASSNAEFTEGSNFITFNFSGTDIGRHGVNGPYKVRSVVLFGVGNSIIVDQLLETSPFSFKEFEDSDNLNLEAITMQETMGDGDGGVEPGENGSLSIPIRNDNGFDITGISATLTSLTPGVTVTSAQSAYPDIEFFATETNTVPFAFTIANSVACGEDMNFVLTVHYDNDGGIPSIFHFSVQPGKPSLTTVNYDGPAVAIPDADEAGVDIPIIVSGVPGTIKDLKFRFGGTTCTADPGATTVGLDHTWVSDLVITLTSPQGTTVAVVSRAGSNGNNFCNTLLDDKASTSINNTQEGDQPFTGTFKPTEPLAAFRGEQPNGTWNLHVVDLFEQDIGNVRQFSLLLTGTDCAVSGPNVTAVCPTSGSTSGGQHVTLSGTDFQPGATVRFDGVLATDVVVSSGTSITATTPAHADGPVDVTITNTNGQTTTLVSGYSYVTSPSEVILQDLFTDDCFDSLKWTANDLISGSSDLSIPISQVNTQLEIGPLLQSTTGSHYRGISSVNSYDFTGAFAQVELVQPAAPDTDAEAMFTAGYNVDNYYRFVVSEGALIAQKNIGGVMTTLLTLSYDSTNHRHLRIRHDAVNNRVVFEAAAGSGRGIGTFVELYSETWTSSVDLTAIKFELKGGTSQSEANAPGKVIFDKFYAGR